MSERITVGNEIRQLLDSDPFGPFIIVMSSGDRYQVRDAREVIFGQDAITLVPLRSGGHSTLRLNQISSLEVSDPRRDQIQEH